MKALVVSRLGLGERIIEKLKESGISKFVDYFKHKDGHREVYDIISVANEQGCDSVAIISNFYLATLLLANGIRTVYVIVPRYHNYVEIISGDVYEIRGSINVLHYKV